MSQLNSDLANLIDSVQIAIVIVGRDLRIRRFSPMAEKLLDITASDLGRAISDLDLKIDLPALDSLLLETIDTVSSREREIQNRQGRWYLLRTRPYVTLEKKIDGAVLVILDVDAIRAAREYAESIIATVHEPLVVLDSELCIRSASLAFYEVFQCAPAATEGHLLSEIGGCEWKNAELLRRLKKCLLEDITFNDFELDCDFKGIGQRKFLLNARRIIQTTDLSPLLLLAIKDVTESKRSEAALLESRAQFEALFDTSPIGKYLVDDQLRIRLVSRKARLAFGNIGELIGRDFVEVIHILWPPQAADDIVARFRHTLETGEPYEASEFSEERYDRKVREYYSWQIHRIALPGGQSGVVCHFIDISARVLAENLLRESEIRYRRLFEAAKDGVLILNPETRKILDANPFMSELLGYTHDELVGKELSEIGLLKDEEASRAAFRELKEKSFIRYEDLPLQSKSGKCREVEMVSNIYKEDGKSIVQCNIRDISQRKQLEDELKARNEELAAADSGKNQFLAMLAHELRSPLNAICGWVKLLQRPDVSAEKINEGLKVIDRNSRAQGGLISDLLTVHRISSGKMRLEVAELNLSELLSLAVAAVLPAATEKEINIESEIEPTPVLISGDARRLEQVFGNLLVNAIKFTPLEGKIRVALRRAESRAEVIVNDTGEGISKEALPYIFERFRQADPSTSRGHGGLGLGLAIAKQLIELHSGSISAYSAGKGQGTTFTVVLPLLLKEEGKRQSPLTSGGTENEKVLLGGVMVLIVDDELDAREPLRQFLEETHAEVIAVGSANEALEAIRQQRPDVIVSDIGMPGRDGYDFIRSVRVLPPGQGGRTPAIALTAYAAVADRDHALKAGFEMHLAKPVDSEALVAAIAALVAPLDRRVEQKRRKIVSTHNGKSVSL